MILAHRCGVFLPSHPVYNFHQILKWPLYYFTSCKTYKTKLTWTGLGQFHYIVVETWFCGFSNKTDIKLHKKKGKLLSYQCLAHDMVLKHPMSLCKHGQHHFPSSQADTQLNQHIYRCNMLNKRGKIVPTNRNTTVRNTHYSNW